MIKQWRQQHHNKRDTACLSARCKNARLQCRHKESPNMWAGDSVETSVLPTLVRIKDAMRAHTHTLLLTASAW